MIPQFVLNEQFFRLFRQFFLILRESFGKLLADPLSCNVQQVFRRTFIKRGSGFEFDFRCHIAEDRVGNVFVVDVFACCDVGADHLFDKVIFSAGNIESGITGGRSVFDLHSRPGWCFLFGLSRKRRKNSECADCDQQCCV